MGVCVSIPHKDSAMKAQVSFDSNNKPDHTNVVHPSVSNGKLPVMNGHVAVKPQLAPSQSPATFSDFGSKEESFFDSHAWLDSDYEDEFMSVNGDFTPSRGNTPVHHSSFVETTRFNGGAITLDNNRHPGSTSGPSPMEMKRLMDLFKESLRTNHDSDEEIVEQPNKNSEIGSNGDGLKPNKERSVGYVHGCFSSLLSSRSSLRKKKKKTPTPTPSMSPNPVVG